MFKRMLVPLDGSANDEIVLEHVKRLAKEFGAAVNLIMLHRLAPSDDPFEKQMQMEDGSSGWRAKRKAAAYLPHLEHVMGQEGIRVSTEFLFVEEPEADAIAKYAEKQDCDLIVFANRERSPMGRFLLWQRRREGAPKDLIAGAFRFGSQIERRNSR